MTTIRRRVFGLSFALSLGSTIAGQSPNPYRIAQTYTLGGDGGWDYIVPDPPHHRLFIGRQNRVMVVDENDGKLLGEVTGIDGAHGTAIVDRTGHGFATSGNDDTTLTIIHQDSPDAYHVLQTLAAAQGARNLGLDPATHRVFIATAAFGPQPAGSRGRAPVLPGSFKLMVVEHQ